MVGYEEDQLDSPKQAIVSGHRAAGFGADPGRAWIVKRRRAGCTVGEPENHFVQVGYSLPARPPTKTLKAAVHLADGGGGFLDLHGLSRSLEKAS